MNEIDIFFKKAFEVRCNFIIKYQIQFYYKKT